MTSVFSSGFCHIASFELHPSPKNSLCLLITPRLQGFMKLWLGKIKCIQKDKKGKEK